MGVQSCGRAVESILRRSFEVIDDHHLNSASIARKTQPNLLQRGKDVHPAFGQSQKDAPSTRVLGPLCCLFRSGRRGGVRIKRRTTSWNRLWQPNTTCLCGKVINGHLTALSMALQPEPVLKNGSQHLPLLCEVSGANRLRDKTIRLGAGPRWQPGYAVLTHTIRALNQIRKGTIVQPKLPRRRVVTTAGCP